MKQVAAAKIRRAEQARKRSRPYSQTLSEMLGDLVAAVGALDHPFMKEGKAGAPPGAIVMSADKGLAGAFNANVIRLAEQFVQAHPGARLYAIGLKARNAARRIAGPECASWPLAGDKLQIARAVASQTTLDFTEGRIAEIVLVSSTFVSMMSQRPQERRLVPILKEAIAEDRDRSASTRGAVEFLPSPEIVLSHLLPKYLEFTLYAAMLETDAAFFAAQLIAMSNATDNAGKAIDESTVEMNNARQAAITKELLEIVAGAEALAG